MTIQTKIRVGFIFLFAHDHSTKMYCSLSFILSFVYDHSTKIRVLIDLFLLFVHNHLTKLYGPLSFIFCMTIQPKIRFRINFLYFICARTFNQKLGSSLINLFHLYTTIWPKIRALINLMFLFVHNYSTKN